MSDTPINMNPYNRSQALTALKRRIPEAHAKSVRSSALVAQRQVTKLRRAEEEVERYRQGLVDQLARMDEIKAELAQFEQLNHPRLASLFDDRVDALAEIEGRWLTTQVEVKAMITKALRLGADKDELLAELDLVEPEWDLDDESKISGYRYYTR